MKDVIHAILPFIGPILQGVSAAVVAGLSLIPILRSLRKAKQELTATTASMQRVVANSLQAAADKEDPKRYWTLSVVWKGGLAMAIPMFPLRALFVAENIEMAVLDTDPEKTVCMLRCRGFGHLPPHHHKGTCETIEVRSGVVTHTETGHQYRAGDKWVIEPEEIHSATFQDCVLFITYRPPLPTADVQPVDLTVLHQLYPFPP